MLLAVRCTLTGALAAAAMCVAPTARGEEPAPPPSASPSSSPLSTNEQDEDYVQVVQVRGSGWSSPRGLGDIRVKRELLDASPRQQASEMLSAAPGFFVDHEEGEGMGNDVYLRGFDLDHGSGIEMRLGSIPINIPLHIQGQGYADANFIIPEVVRSIRVLEGAYDPRQGDAAIVGSAIFDLGVRERGYQLKSTYGSFHQGRVVAIAAPSGADDETFAAFALRKTDGFGENRAGESGAINTQYAVDLGTRARLRLLGAAYGARSSLPGVVRQDDLDAGRIGYYDSYPSLAEGQGVQSSRIVVGADFDDVSPDGGRFEIAPWVMSTTFRARQNYTGALERSSVDPAAAGLGDLFETTNDETAAGFTSRFHSHAARLGDIVEIAAEPGVELRAGHTEQTKSLLDPSTLVAWDRRIDAGLHTLDIGSYLDLDIRIAKRLRVSGGPRVDFLAVSIDDRLANAGPPGSAPSAVLPGAVRSTSGIAAGPRVTAEYQLAHGFSPVVSYGEGFRSLDAQGLGEGATPYSKVRSVEGGFRMQTPKERYTTTLALFETWVDNELVFEASSGGMETESASVRRGLVTSLVAKPFDWLVASTALSLTNATFTTPAAGGSHYVPNVPPILFRADVSARRTITSLAGAPVTGRAGAGYTFLAGRHLTDSIVGPSASVLNAGAAARWTWVEVGVDAYNLLGLEYPDDEEYYVSNWGFSPGQRPASPARHIIAAPPRTMLGTVSLYF